jgi:hypothetical protein
MGLKKYYMHTLNKKKKKKAGDPTHWNSNLKSLEV